MTQASPYRVETIKSIARLQEIAPALDRLVTMCAPAFYHETAFLLPWCTTANRLGQKPHFIAVWTKQDRLVAFVPLCRRRDPKALLAYRLSTPRIGSSPPFDALLAPDADQTPLVAAIAAQLAQSSWVDMLIPQTLAHSNFATTIAPALARTGMTLGRKDEGAYLKVSGYKSSQEWLANFKSKNRVDLNRQYARFLEACDIVTIDAVQDLDKAFDWIDQVTAHSWKEKLYLHDTFLPLLRSQLEGMCAAGHARIRFALKSDLPIAYLVEFFDEGGARSAYYNAHDPRENYHSPGISLMQHSVRQALDETTPAYLFLGNHEYIRKLSSETDAICTVEVMRTGLHARFCGAMVRLVSNARQRRPRSRRA